MFGAPSAESVVFTYNTTYALNLAIKGLTEPGAHVLISDMEHNAVLRPIEALARRGVCTYDLFPTSGGDRAIIEGIRARLRPNTRMLVCNHASNVGGRSLPLAAIGALCRLKGVIFVVDAAQSAGILPISVKSMNISALCMPGHKGLYGPQGVGVLILGEGMNGATIIEGGTGVRSLEKEMPETLPERYEAGTLGVPAIAGLGAGLKWIRDRGIAGIAEEERRLSHLSQAWLGEIGAVTLYSMSLQPSGTFCFNIRGKSPQTVAEELDAAGICVRAGFHCAPLAHQILGTGESGAVRVSLGAFNTLEEIAFLCDTVEKISQA